MCFCLLDICWIPILQKGIPLPYINFFFFFGILVRGHCERAFWLFPCCLLLGNIDPATVRALLKISKYNEQI